MSDMMLKFFFIALNCNIEWTLQSLPGGNRNYQQENEKKTTYTLPPNYKPTIGPHSTSIRKNVHIHSALNKTYQTLHPLAEREPHALSYTYNFLEKYVKHKLAPT